MSYTADELAARARAELGADVNSRTIYFYRQIGVLSAAEPGGAGSQPRFGERHFLELAAALALQRAPDRPTLAAIATMLRGLSEDRLRELAAAVGPTSRELLAAPPAAPAVAPAAAALREAPAPPPFYVDLAEPPVPWRPAGQPPARATTVADGAGVTINLAPGITLFAGPDASPELLSKLLSVSLQQTAPTTPPPGGGSPGSGAARRSKRQAKTREGTDEV